MPDNEFRIYLDSDTCLYHVNQFDHKLDPESISRNVDGFLSGQVKHRYAAFHVYFQGTDWIDRLRQVYDACDCVFVFCTELHEHTVSVLKTLDLPRVRLYLNGYINDYEFQHATINVYMDWFYTTTDFYLRNQPNFLAERLTPYQPKPKLFDALLGCSRNHRDFVYQWVNEHGLQDQLTMTYVRVANKDLFTNPEFIFDLANIEFLNTDTITHSVGYVRYHGAPMSISQIVPVDIYQQTAYSLVAETNAVNSFNFYTEKIVKPILARRLFVVIGGQHYLKNLRRLGFQTFSNIIDESYDDVADDKQRWTAALEQVQWLCQQDQSKILKQVQEVAEFNLQVLGARNWYRDVMQDFEALLVQS